MLKEDGVFCYRAQVQRLASYFSSPRWFVALALLLLANLLFGGALLFRGRRASVRANEGGVSDRPNILLITVDLMRPDFLGCYAKEGFPTPNIDALAAHGVLFEKAYAQAERTGPSHLCIFTSRYLSECFRARASPTMLAEVLRANGYDTASIPSSAMLLGPSAQSGELFDFTRGFGTVYPIPPNGETNLPFIKRSGTEATALARTFITSHAEGARPWFLFLNYRDIHPPHDSDPLAALHGPCYAPVTHIDAWIGSLMKLLDEGHGGDRTVVVLMSPHGCEDVRDVRATPDLREKALRVPLIMRLPGGPSGLRVGSVVETIDVMPTLLKRYLPSVSVEMSGKADVLSEHGGRLAYAQSERLEGCMATDGRWKYIEYVRPSEESRAVGGSVTPPPRLVDLTLGGAADSSNLLAQAPDQARRLRRAIVERLGSAAVQGSASPIPAIPASARRRLKALDYW